MPYTQVVVLNEYLLSEWKHLEQYLEYLMLPVIVINITVIIFIINLTWIAIFSELAVECL